MAAVLAKDFYYPESSSYNAARMPHPVIYIPVSAEHSSTDAYANDDDDDDRAADDNKHTWSHQQRQQQRCLRRADLRHHLHSQNIEQQQQQWVVPPQRRYPVYSHVRPPQPYTYHPQCAPYAPHQAYLRLPQRQAGPRQPRVFLTAPVGANHEQLRRQQQFYLNSSHKQQQLRMPPPSRPSGGDMLDVLAAACSLPNATHPNKAGGEKRSREPRKVPFVGPPATEVPPPRRKKRPRLAPFPNKLQEIVVGNPDVVTWDERTRALVIRDPRKLSSQVMPKYFNTSGGDGLLKSFTRQLNYYGFHRITSLKAASVAPALKKNIHVGGGGDSEETTQKEESLLLLHLGGGDDNAKSENKAKNLLRQISVVESSEENDDDDALVGFYRDLFGDEALVFINKDKTLSSVDDFPRLIRFEKATARVTLDDYPSTYPFRGPGGTQLTNKGKISPVA